MTGPPTPNWTNKGSDMTETKEMSDEGKRLDKIRNYQEILGSLRDLKAALEKEDPPPLFEWVVESKIRAYGRKLMRIHPPSDMLRKK